MQHVYITGEITSETTHQVVEFLVKSGTGDLVVYVDSPGGCPRSAFAIYEALRASGKKVTTHAVNLVASAAVIIYLAGTERFATPYSQFLIHEVMMGEIGFQRAKDMKKNQKELEEDTDRIYELVASHTNLSKLKIVKKVKSAHDNDWTFEVKEALKIGFVTHEGFPFPKLGRKRPKAPGPVLPDPKA